MPSNFPTALFLAAFWASAGCGWVRYRWRASYDVLCVLWLMTFFGFGLINQAVFLRWFSWPNNVLLSAVAVAAPAVAFFGHFGGSATPEPLAPPWARFVFGAMLMGAAACAALWSDIFVGDLWSVAQGVGRTPLFAGYLVLVLGIGLFGLGVVLRAPKEKT